MSSAFFGFAPPAPSDEEFAALRRAIEAATRRPEADCIRELIEAASLPPPRQQRVAAIAGKLAAGVRQTRSRASGVDALMSEFSLDSAEGAALMCLAEALLRVPDDAGRDHLIRDKLRNRDWSSHVGHSPSLFVNAAAWSLALTGRLLGPEDEVQVHGALGRLATRGGEALIREAMDCGMRLVGQQFPVLRVPTVVDPKPRMQPNQPQRNFQRDSQTSPH